MKLQPIPLFLSLSLLFILPTHAQNRTCYFLDGSVATADVPCTSDATTNCCNKNDICMSNGLCYLQGSHGMSLSRGSCTDKSWGARCFAPCSSTNRNNGFPVVNVGFSGSSSKYCCGSVTVKDGSTTCSSEGDPFTITMGTAIPGVAALAVNNSDSDSGSGSGSGSDSNNNSTCDDADYKLKEKALDNHDVAIGVGVGVPLGVIAIASIAWALYERRQRRSAVREVGEKGDAGGYMGLNGGSLSGSMNMGGNGNMGGNMGMGGMPLAELNTTQASAQRPVELDSGKVHR